MVVPSAEVTEPVVECSRAVAVDWVLTLVCVFMCCYPFLSSSLMRRKLYQKVTNSSGCSIGARLEREKRQPQITHFEEDAVESCLVTDLTGKQGGAILIVRDQKVLKPCLPKGVQVSLHTNDISHTLVLRSDDVL